MPKTQICAVDHIPPSRKGRTLTEEKEEAMNHSVYNADGRAHLKIVVVGLLAATLVVVVGKFAQVGDVDLGTAPLVKAGQPIALSGRLPVVR
jgi:hypothetical protein